ncbi:hypothetical protein [Schnuerera sp.]|uniref:hypothetical protein n=1 Tax=Schnuerera sp. TaxID=2794844 RepID=UPI002BE6F45F|nr:hypothetical protein [Schnuerera sp.]HSH35228.1 hypothetical protein [Schnuerera sp.]
MREKRLLIILIFIILVLFFRTIYNQTLSTEEYISSELHDHYAVLTHIVADIGKHSNHETDNIDEFYIRRLLEISRNFEFVLNRYENAHSKSKETKENDVREITSLINNYYNLFVDSVSAINETDYDTLNMIKNDLEKWILWIEENYISTDKDGYYVYKMYAYEDMVESGLIDELDLADFQR